MIEPDKLNNALYALQGVLIHARTMAYEKADYKALATLLDYAEELPRLIATHENMTERFKSSLSEIATRYECHYILHRFENPPEIW